MRNTLTGYDVGALLYCPANAHTSIADSLVGQRFPTPFSLAFCLEDTVSADSVAEAERILQNTLERISAASRQHTFFLPPIFVRVRSPQQLLRLAETYAPYAGILAGFILPKFFLDNCGPYVAAIRSISQTASYVYMPIFESAAMIPPAARQTALAEIREQLDTVSGSILNVRVGGNDLSHAFGLRRPVDRTIYDLRPVADILIDIVTTFGDRYVVSGPVWEYYSGEGWDTGLRRELEMDLLNGFIGKTVIHPNQIPVVNEMLRVSVRDYADARAVLNWDAGSGRLVAASAGADRMNEYNTHFNWAGNSPGGGGGRAPPPSPHPGPRRGNPRGGAVCAAGPARQRTKRRTRRRRVLLLKHTQMETSAVSGSRISPSPSLRSGWR